MLVSNPFSLPWCIDVFHSFNKWPKLHLWLSLSFCFTWAVTSAEDFGSWHKTKKINSVTAHKVLLDETFLQVLFFPLFLSWVFWSHQALIAKLSHTEPLSPESHTSSFILNIFINARLQLFTCFSWHVYVSYFIWCTYPCIITLKQHFAISHYSGIVQYAVVSWGGTLLKRVK